MSEPTRNVVESTTNSATERLRALLDERGVRWWQSANTLGCVFTRWQSPLFGDEVCAMENGEEGLVLFDHFVTPEQAVAATLGQEDTYTREDVEGAFVSGYSLGSLPVGSDPQWDQNEQTVDEHMAELGWVRLPVSEDGDVLHIGELVDEKLPFGGYAAPAPIDTMELSRGAGGYGWMVRLDSESGAFINPKLLRHHHAPTVEDVLREFAYGLGVPVADSYVAATAAKLRLKEG